MLEIANESANENLQAENLRTLFKRLYGAAEGQAKLNFHEESDDFYLAHALIQIILYEVDQECIISRDVGRCINDGTTACVMTLDTLKRLGQNSRDYFSSVDITDTKIKNNPVTRDPIKPETFYFVNCHIEKDFYSRSNLVGDRFNHDDFIKYKKQYLQAILIYLNLEKPSNKISALFNEIKQLVPNLEIKVVLRAFNFDGMRADDIYKLLASLKKHDSPLGKAVTNMFDDAEFQKLYEALKEGPIDKLKDFLVKCLLIIYHSLKWCFTLDTISEAKEKWRKSVADNTKEFSDFRDYVTSSLQSEAGLQQMV
jgi:hypothetical protein